MVLFAKHDNKQKAVVNEYTFCYCFTDILTSLYFADNMKDQESTSGEKNHVVSSVADERLFHKLLLLYLYQSNFKR